MSIHEFAASGKILVEVTEQIGDDADFGMSGIIAIPDYSTVPLSISRQWIDGDDVYEAVVSGLPPAPGQTVYLTDILTQYLEVIEGHFWITNSTSQSFSMPIPQHVPDGMLFVNGSYAEDGGIWTVVYDGNLGIFMISASADAYDFTQDPNFIIHGVVRFINV